MRSYVEKSKGGKNSFSQKRRCGESSFQFEDNRPKRIAQKKLRKNNCNSSQVQGLTKTVIMANSTTQMMVDNRPVIQFYPSYQTFKDADRNTYCSPNKVKNHTEGARWIRDAVNALGVTVLGRPRESHNIPRNAIVWP